MNRGMILYACVVALAATPVLSSAGLPTGQELPVEVREAHDELREALQTLRDYHLGSEGWRGLVHFDPVGDQDIDHFGDGVGIFL